MRNIKDIGPIVQLYLLNEVTGLIINSLNYLLKQVKEKIFYTLTVESGENIYSAINEYIAKNTKRRSDNLTGARVDKNKKINLLVSPPNGRFFLKYKGKYIIAIKSTDIVVDELYDRITLFVPWFLESLLKEFIQEVFSEYYTSPTRKPKIIVNDCGMWINIKNNSRKLESVFLPQQIKQRIICDIEKFVEDKDKYVNNGITWSRKYLLDGLPGTGKTSFVIAIAEYFKYDIYYIDMASLSMNASLGKLTRGLNKPAIVLIDDIDIVAPTRTCKGEGGIDLSYLLNTIDGVFAPDGVVWFFTSNHKDKLDPALVRPGRIDMVIDFTFTLPEQLKDYCIYYYGDDAINIDYSNIKQLTMAEIQNLNQESNSLDEFLRKVLN